MRKGIREYRHNELVGRLNNLIYQVRDELKTGWSEEIYHQALLHTLKENSVPVISKPRRSLLHRGTEVHIFEPDLIVYEKIILELKSLPYQKEFVGENYAQLIHYLKFWQMDLGLLINYALKSTKIKRVIWDEPELDILEDYTKFREHLTAEDKPIFRQIRQATLDLANQYGLGYPETIYRKMFALEMAHIGLDCISDLQIPPTIWHKSDLPSLTTTHLLINQKYLIHICGLREYPTAHHFRSTQNYLACLNLKFALIVNFGKSQLQLFALRSA